MALSLLILGLTVAVTVWTAVVVPLLPIELVASAMFEHIVLGLTAIATLAVAAIAHAGR